MLKVKQEGLQHVCSRTSFCVHREVWLPLQNTVDDTSAVSIRGVVGVCGSELDHRRS